MELLIYIGSVLTSIILIKYLPSYASEKGKNLATKEDIEEITKKVENIKTDNQIKIDKKIREFLKKDKDYDELKTLYIKIHEMLEESIKVTKNYDTNDLNSQFSKLTAEVRMIASSEVIKKYLNVTNLFSNWNTLYIKAFPKAVNGIQILYSKSADQTLKYKEPEKDAYAEFYKEYEDLIEGMRLELTSNI